LSPLSERGETAKPRGVQNWIPAFAGMTNRVGMAEFKKILFETAWNCYLNWYL